MLEVILILWGMLLVFWSVGLIYASVDIHRRQTEIRLERARWLARADQLRRQEQYGQGRY